MTDNRAERGGLVFWGGVLAMLAVMIGLGTWQMQRREWKLGLIEQIESRAHGEAISLSRAKEFWQKNRDVEYYRVLLVGQFRHELEHHLYTILDGKAGWRVITPLVTASGDVVLVDRGYVPDELKDPATRKAGQVTGTVELIGLARAAVTPSWFTPKGDSRRNQWFARDVEAMAGTLPKGMADRVAPFLIEAEAGPLPGGWPRGGVTQLNLSNRHLEYALTWYGLAVTLLVIAVLVTRSRSRQTARQL
jgi:surfeit locus 1 family protein